MITRLARRLGFQPSVPVSVINDWLMPRSGQLTALSPRGGQATCLVDQLGRVQPAHRSFTLDWTLAAGARWVSAIESERVKHRLVAPAVAETTVQTPSGPVVQRVAAAVVDGEPVAVIEIENRAAVAIAVGLVARPLVHTGRGLLERAATTATRLDLGDQGVVRSDTPAAATAVSDGIDLLQAMPSAHAGVDPTRIESRSGGAQAAAVFALPHTATMRVVVELGASVRPQAAVPSTDEVQRGWGVHLESGARFAVGDSAVEQRCAVATRGLLTSWPDDARVGATITALAELGFGDDSARLFSDLDRLDDDPTLLAALARWAQLGQTHSQLDRLDRIIGPVARSAHAANASRQLSGPGWMPSAFAALADRLDMIEQPEVADRVRELTPVIVEPTIAIDELLATKTGLSDLASLAAPATATRLVLGVRACLLADRQGGVDLLPALPEAWRGKSIDVLDVPVQDGTISFGVRWHGERAALLWQVTRETPFEITASAIDPDFGSTDSSGETLLADPGWPRQ